MRRILAAAVALAPLSMACSAFAQTTISNTQTGPVVVPSAGLTVASGGLVTPGTSTLAGACLTSATTCYVGVFQGVQSTVSNQGTIGNNSLTTSGNAVSVLIQANTPSTTLIGAATQGSFTNTTTISLGNGYASPYNSSTGITYGAWATGTNNVGIRLIPGAAGSYFAGYIDNASGATITVSGNNSYGISVEAALDGSLSTQTQSTITSLANSTDTAGATRNIAIESAGSITVIGDNSVGLNIAAPVKGDVLIQGAITASGANASGITTSNAISGRLTIGSTITATGFHYTSRPADQTITNFLTQPGYTPTGSPNGAANNSEFILGGPAVSVGGSISGGILLDLAPDTASATAVGGVTDVDGDGIPDAGQTTGSIASYGSAPALQIGSNTVPTGTQAGTPAVLIGPVGTTNTDPALDINGNKIYNFNGVQLTNAELYDYALIIKGVISASGVYDQINATAINLFTGVASSPSVPYNTVLTGGINLEGTITAGAYNATATAINIGAGVSLPQGATTTSGGINNYGGSIEATVLTSTVTPLVYTGTGTPPVGEVTANATAAQILAAQASVEALQNAYGINIAAGANVPLINNTVSYLATGGIISAQVAGGYGNAIAIRDASGTLTQINNNGQILAVVDTTPGTTPNDEIPQATYVDGRCQTGSGGCAIAIDAQGTAASTGLAINQGLSNVTGALASNVNIVGDIYLPSHNTAANSALNINAGSVVGTIQLGNGNVAINIGGGAIIRGPLFSDGANVSIDIANGTLDDGVISTTSPTPKMLTVNTLTVGSLTGNGTLYVTVDPTHGDTSGLSGYNGFNVTGKAELYAYSAGTGTYGQTGYVAPSGASLGINFANLVPSGQTVVMNVISAGTLQIDGNIDTSPVIHPILFAVTVGTSAVVTGCPTNSVCVSAQQATTAQLGMNKAQASVYQGVYAALNGGTETIGTTVVPVGDTGLRDLFLGETATSSATPNGAQDFFRDYNQLIPVSAGASLLSIQNGLEAANRALDDSRPLAEPGETTGWVQEIDYYTDKSGVNAQGFRAHGAGFAAGLERGTPVGAFGISTTFSTGDMKSPDQVGTSDLSSTLYEVGGYWRFQHGGWRAWSRFGAGYVTFNSNREFIDNPVVPPEITTTTPVQTTSTTGVTTVTGVTTSSTPAPLLTRTATANYSGYTAAAAAGISYEQHFWRRYFIRPEASIEYLYLHEDGYTEQNGTSGLTQTTNGILLAVDSQSSHILTTRALVNFGARYGDQGQNGFTAEFHVGYQDNINADPGLTVVQYLSDVSGKKYAIAADSLTGGGPVAGFRLMAGGPMGYIALEGDVEDLDSYTTYMIMLRAAFRF